MSGALFGEIAAGEWTVLPSLEWGYISENQKSYADSLNVLIPGRTVSQGNISMGPKFSRDFALSDDKTLTLFTKLQGVYTFGESGKFSNGTLAAETQGFTATARAGFDIRTKSGAQFSLSGGIGGSGSDANTYTGSVMLSFPLN